MFKKIKKYFLTCLFKKLLSKKGPKEIPRSGENVKTVNYYSTYFGSLKERPVYLLEGLEGTEVKVKEISDKTAGSTTLSLGYEEALSKGLHIVHYYKEYESRYSSISKFILLETTALNELYINILKTLKWMKIYKYKRKKLVTQDSHSLLRYIITHTTKTESSSQFLYRSSRREIHFYEIMRGLYTENWALHPDMEFNEALVELHLEALVESGNLSQSSSSRKYSLKGKAIHTLEKYEEENTRHNEIRKIQSGLFWLTLVIAVSSLFQAEILTKDILKDLWLEHFSQVTTTNISAEVQSLADG